MPIAPYGPKSIPAASVAACTSSTSDAAPARSPASTSTSARELSARGSSLSAPASRQVRVPQLVGKSYSQATQALSKAGLLFQRSGPLKANATISAQYPAAGTLVKPGTRVTIYLKK